MIKSIAVYKREAKLILFLEPQCRGLRGTFAIACFVLSV